MRIIHTLPILAILIGSTSSTFAESSWKIERTQDEMTDEVSYFIYTTGSKVRIDNILIEKPNLVMKATPKKTDKSGALYYSADIMFQIEIEGLHRDECEIMTRYDKRKPTVENWRTSTDRRAAFSPHWSKTLADIQSSTNLTVRYMTTLGNVRTTTFNVLGLTDALKEMKSMHLKSHRK